MVTRSRPLFKPSFKTAKLAFKAISSIIKI
jgi:hypothetical protein